MEQPTDVLTTDVSLVKLTILHKVSRYGDPPQHRKVFTCWARKTLGVHDLLELLFEEFNIGETSEVAKAYRAAGLRSLSVGDVVIVGEDLAYLCDSVGWAEIDLSREGLPTP